MNYIEVQLALDPFLPFNEILVAELSEFDFESFVEEESKSTLKGYILKSDFNLTTLEDCCAKYQDALKVNIQYEEIEKENWNEKWEQNFESVSVGDFCYVRAPFHPLKETFKHEIIIEPKMSFGTGHHQTTQMMIELMENIDFTGKTVLDMGSGTGILAILAKKMGADKVIAIDIEEWAAENMIENFQRNEVKVDSYQGGVEVISALNLKYDIIIANINKNILLDQFSEYNRVLLNKGNLLLSGFFKSDKEDLLNSPNLLSFSFEEDSEKDTWTALRLRKENH